MMRLTIRVFTAVFALAFAARGATAQTSRAVDMIASDRPTTSGGGSGGCSVGPGFECSEVNSHTGEGKDRRSWFRAIVITRQPREVALSRRSSAAAADGVLTSYREASREAENAGRTLLSGYSSAARVSMTWGRMGPRKAPDTVFVNERGWELPVRDSALVLMIDPSARDANGEPVVTTAWMNAQIDESYWSKMWMSGDTTFIVRPRNNDTILRGALLSVPAIRGFMQR